MKAHQGQARASRTAWLPVVMTLGLMIGARSASAQSAIFSGAGTADATTALNQFRAAVGSVNNGGTAAPQIGGRREINWDGVALDGTDFGGQTITIDPGHTVAIPENRFQSRGVIFGDIYAVSGDGFQSVNPCVTGQFPAFSPHNTFAMFDKPDEPDFQIDVSFVVPSNPATVDNPPPAVVRGFGAIFIDVEHKGTSSITYHTTQGDLTFPVPAGPSGQPEFLGVVFNQPIVTGVTLTPGEGAVFTFDPNDPGSGFQSGPPDITLGGTPACPEPGIDLAVTDDFAYSEPVALDRCIIVSGRFAGFQITPSPAEDDAASGFGVSQDVSPAFNPQTRATGTLTPVGGGSGQFVGTILGGHVNALCIAFASEGSAPRSASDVVMTNLGIIVALNQPPISLNVANQGFINAEIGLGGLASQLLSDLNAGFIKQATFRRLRTLLRTASLLEAGALQAFSRAVGDVNRGSDPRAHLAKALALLNGALQAKQTLFKALHASDNVLSG